MIRLKVSPGNTKTGRIPAVSHTPVKGCAPWVKGFCGKKGKCYALKSYNIYPNVKTAWDSNLRLLKTNPGSYFRQLWEYLDKKKPKFFRYHVSGDFVSKEHFQLACDTGRRFPDTKSLAFTKCYRKDRDVLDGADIPDNFEVVLSVWEGMTPSDIPIKYIHFRYAYAGDCKSFDSYHSNSIECPGNCETCGMCWELSKLGKDVKFNLRGE